MTDSQEPENDEEGKREHTTSHVIAGDDTNDDSKHRNANNNVITCACVRAGSRPRPQLTRCHAALLAAATAAGRAAPAIRVARRGPASGCGRSAPLAVLGRCAAAPSAFPVGARGAAAAAGGAAGAASDEAAMGGEGGEFWGSSACLGFASGVGCGVLRGKVTVGRRERSFGHRMHSRPLHMECYRMRGVSDERKLPVIVESPPRNHPTECCDLGESYPHPLEPESTPPPRSTPDRAQTDRTSSSKDRAPATGDIVVSRVLSAPGENLGRQVDRWLSHFAIGRSSLCGTIELAGRAAAVQTPSG